MKLVVLLVVLLLFHVFFFFIINAIQKKIIKKHFIIIIIFYILGLSFFNYASIRFFLKTYYNTNYDTEKLSKTVNTKKDEIDNISKENELMEEELKKDSNQKIISEINELQSNLETITKEKDSKLAILNNKEEEFKTLDEEYKKLKSNTEYQIKDFPIINQYPKYPNGCEIASLYMILRYYNINVSLEDLANELEKGPAPYTKNGKRYAADPEVAYVGDPRLTNGKGYGVYQKPIIKLASKYKPGMIDVTGSNLSSVLKIVREGKPVQVWASVGLKNVKVCTSWTGVETGNKVDWMCGLHSMVIIGYNYDKVIIADPYYGKIKYYSKKQFEKIYNKYGKRAIYYE